MSFVPELSPTMPSFNGPRGTTTNPQFTDVALVANALQERDGKGVDSDTKAGHLLIAHSLRAEGADASEDGTGRGTPLVVQDVREMEKAQNGLGVSEGDVAYTLDGTGAQGVTQPLTADYAKTPDHNGVRDAGNVLIGFTAVRRLTPLECERLQGFPDGWTATDAEGKPISDSARYRMLGNAVAVPVAAWIGRRIAERA